MNDKMDIQKCSYGDDIPSSLKTFCDNYKKKYGKEASLHNLYLLQTTDMNGNITGEAYGINLMTNLGFQNFTNNKSLDLLNCKMYIGSGDVEPTLTDTTLTSAITSVGSTRVSGMSFANSGGIVQYPSSYDSTTGIYSKKWQVYIGYFDYNITDITEDQNIREVGFGSSVTNIYTHALVYDINADNTTTPIVKKINERLTITMFWSMAFKPQFIKDLYDKNIFMVTNYTPFMYHLMKRSTSSDPEYLLTFAMLKKNDDYIDRDTNGNASQYYMFDGGTTSMNNIATYQVSPDISAFMQNKRQYLSKLVTLISRYAPTSISYGYGRKCYMFIINNIKSGFKLSTPEPLEMETAYTHKCDKPEFLHFGSYYNSQGTKPDEDGSGAGDRYYNYYGQYPYLLPCTQFDMKSCQIYNHLTKDWEDEEFTNNPNFDYDASLYFEVTEWMETPIGNKDARIYMNTQTEYPITYFEQTGMIMYATDEYWDKDTWVLIPDTSNVPEALQKKRYYIRLDTNDNLPLEHYECTKHTIVPKTQTRDMKITDTIAQYVFLANEEKGFFITQSQIIYPGTSDENDIKYNIKSFNDTGTNNRYRYLTNNGDKLLMGSATSSNFYKDQMRIYTIIDSSTEPTYVDVSLEFTTASTGDNAMYRTFSTNGFYCSQQISNQECVILDLYGDESGTPTQTKLTNVQNCTAIAYSDYCVYQTDDTTTLTFDIYDMKNNNVVKSFSLPEMGYTFAGIVGWKKYVYVRVKQAELFSTYFYNIEDERLEHLSSMNIEGMYWWCNPNGSYNKQSYYSDRISMPLFNDECMIVSNNYVYDGSGKQNGVLRSSGYDLNLFTNDYPSDPIQVLTSYVGDKTLAGSSSSSRYIFYTGIYSTNGGKHLVMMGYDKNFTIETPFIIDLGKVIDTRKQVDFLPIYRYTELQKDEYSYLYGIGVFKNQVYIDVEQKNNEQKVAKLYPIEYWLPHKISGETYTIQTWNNPKRVSFPRTHKFSITNNLSKWTIE